MLDHLTDVDGQPRLRYMRTLHLLMDLNEFKPVRRSEEDFEGVFKAFEHLTDFINSLPALRVIRIELKVNCMGIEQIETYLRSHRWRAMVEVLQPNNSGATWKSRNVRLEFRLGHVCEIAAFRPDTWMLLLALVMAEEETGTMRQDRRRSDRPLHVLDIDLLDCSKTFASPFSFYPVHFEVSLKMTNRSIALLALHISLWFPYVTRLTIDAEHQENRAEDNLRCHLPLLRILHLKTVGTSALAPFLKNFDAPGLQRLNCRIHLSELDMDEAGVFRDDGPLTLFLSHKKAFRRLDIELLCHAVQWHQFGPSLNKLRIMLSARKATLRLVYRGCSRLRTAMIADLEVTDSAPAWNCSRKAVVHLDQLPLSESVILCREMESVELTVLGKEGDQGRFGRLLDSFQFPILTELILTFDGSEAGHYIAHLLSRIGTFPNLEMLQVRLEASRDAPSKTVSLVFTERFRLRGIHVAWRVNESRTYAWDLPLQRCRHGSAYFPTLEVGYLYFGKQYLPFRGYDGQA